MPLLFDTIKIAAVATATAAKANRKLYNLELSFLGELVSFGSETYLESGIVESLVDEPDS